MSGETESYTQGAVKKISHQHVLVHVSVLPPSQNIQGFTNVQNANPKVNLTQRFKAKSKRIEKGQFNPLQVLHIVLEGQGLLDDCLESSGKLALASPINSQTEGVKTHTSLNKATPILTRPYLLIVTLSVG